MKLTDIVENERLAADLAALDRRYGAPALDRDARAKASMDAIKAKAREYVEQLLQGMDMDAIKAGQNDPAGAYELLGATTRNDQIAARKALEIAYQSHHPDVLAREAKHKEMINRHQSHMQQDPSFSQAYYNGLAADQAERGRRGEFTD